jgi:hypothetical protein
MLVIGVPAEFVSCVVANVNGSMPSFHYARAAGFPSG